MLLCIKPLQKVWENLFMLTVMETVDRDLSKCIMRGPLLQLNSIWASIVRVLTVSFISVLQKTWCYIRECGKSGRNGQPSVCLLLYNGLSAAYCNMEIKEYTMSNECRRLFIYKHLPGNKSNTVLGQSCCDICEINSTGKLQLVLQPMIHGKTAQDTVDKKVRIATPEQKERLREVLYVCMKTLIISNSTSGSIVSTNLLRCISYKSSTGVL